MSYAKVSHLFDSVESAQNLTTQWLWVYNNERPHFALGGIPLRWRNKMTQKPTFHPLGDFLNPALALLGQGLKKLPIGQKLDFANYPYLCKGLLANRLGIS
jgi:hypothetical protein